MGIVQGDRVGVMLPNCPQYLIAVFGILRIGAIVVNVNPLYTPREIAVVAQDSEMRLLVVLDLLAPAALAARAQTKIEKLIVTSAAEYGVHNAPCPSIEGTERLCDVLASVDVPQLPPVQIDPFNDVAVLQYTGAHAARRRARCSRTTTSSRTSCSRPRCRSRVAPRRRAIPAGHSLLSHLRIHGRPDGRRVARRAADPDPEVRR